MRALLPILIFLFFLSCKETRFTRTKNFPKTIALAENIPAKKNIWVFLLAGQSNMAGRAYVRPEDTISNQRILSVNETGDLIYAKEPLHNYEPNLKGLDCSLSFAKTLLRHIPDSISILLLPTAIGGSSVSQWLGDSLYRGVRLFSNFKEKVELGKKYGQIKGILWHQGETDANEKGIQTHKEDMVRLFKQFRAAIGNDSLPILVGELGTYSKDKKNWSLLNNTLKAYVAVDKYAGLISSSGLKNKGDKIHFNRKGQQKLGQRYAKAYTREFIGY